eukprot:422249-Amphidinium_carterae.1
MLNVHQFVRRDAGPAQAVKHLSAQREVYAWALPRLVQLTVLPSPARLLAACAIGNPATRVTHPPL